MATPQTPEAQPQEPTADIVEKYLLSTDLPRDSSVPLEVFIAFPRSLIDTDTRNQVRVQWQNGNDKQFAAMKLMFEKSVPMIFRPTGVLIDWKTITISIFTPSGLQIFIPNQYLTSFGHTPEQQIDSLNDFMYLTVTKKEDSLVADQCVPLRGKVETEVAKEILAKTNLTPLDVILKGLGYKPSPEVRRLFIPRILTWFKGFDGKPMHVAQFTLPETAKTHFAIRNETLFNWRYIPEPPTLARLILDARQGILGEVFLRNGIIFDEFDKWNLEQADRRLTFDSILTGMEQGKWVRGVSALGVRAPDVSRLIPLLFFGNLGDLEKVKGITQYCIRAWFTEIYTKRLTHDVSALADRLAVIDGCFIKIPIMDSLSGTVLPDSIMRGIIRILQEEVKPCNVSKLRGRLKRHADNAYAILNTFLKIDAPTVDSIVAGTFELDQWTTKTPVTVTVQVPPPRDDYPSFPEP